jgi:hypothetical protein
MVIVGTGTASSRFLKRNYPNVEGLIAGTTKQEGKIMNLVAENSNISEKEKVGLN